MESKKQMLHGSFSYETTEPAHEAEKRMEAALASVGLKAVFRVEVIDEVAP